MADGGLCPIRREACIEKDCRWWYELTDKHGSCSITFAALMLHELLGLLQREKKQQERIWEVDEKTGAALLGRAGWIRHSLGGWQSPIEHMSCDIGTALKSIGLELKDG